MLFLRLPIMRCFMVIDYIFLSFLHQKYKFTKIPFLYSFVRQLFKGTKRNLTNSRGRGVQSITLKQVSIEREFEVIGIKNVVEKCLELTSNMIQK